MSMTNGEIREAVREQYGALARKVGEKMTDLKVQQPQASSCCEPSESTEITASSDCGCGTPQLYDAQMLIDLPDNVTNLSAGCGDPVTIAGLQPGETVLDLGSGGGIDCFLAARRVGDEGFVIGVDMTQEMLDQANANKLKIGAHNVEFRKGHIEDLPVRGNTVDVIMSNCVINLSPDKPAVFAEAFRVLKPGGRLSVSDIVLQGEFSEKMRGDMQQWAGCLVGAIDVNRYMGMMRDVGFTDVQVVDEVDVTQIEVSPEELDNLPDGAITVIKGEEEMPRVFSARITARKPA
jgi:arsenite methyltransferase